MQPAATRPGFRITVLVTSTRPAGQVLPSPGAVRCWFGGHAAEPGRREAAAPKLRRLHHRSRRLCPFFVPVAVITVKADRSILSAAPEIPGLSVKRGEETMVKHYLKYAVSTLTSAMFGAMS